MSDLLTPGRGTFRIKSVRNIDKQGDPLYTKNGDRKVMIVLEATDSKGLKADVFEHITIKAAWKIESICKAAQMPHLYISADNCLDGLEPLEGAVGDCMVGIQDAQNGYPANNVIKSYLPAKNKSVAPVNAPIIDYTELDESIPF